MKWTNKGHELDARADALSHIKTVYLYGAGRIGGLLCRELDLFPDLGWNIALIDRDPEKQANGFRGYPVLPLNHIPKINAESEMLVICLGQGAEALVRQFSGETLSEGVGILTRNDFITPLSAHLLSRHNILFADQIGFTINQVCTLRCRDCSVSMPYKKKAGHKPLDELKRSADLLFSKIDYVGMLHLLGGEPLLHPQLGELIEYIGGRYRNKIAELGVLSNGFTRADPALLEIFRKHGVTVRICDYRDNLDRSGVKDRIGRQIEEYRDAGVSLVITNATDWIDFGFRSGQTFYTGEETLSRHFDRCDNLCMRGLDDGYLLMCNPAFYNKEFLPEEDSQIRLPLESDNPRYRHIILEFLCGYTETGSINSCKYCRGMHDWNKTCLPPGIQL